MQPTTVKTIERRIRRMRNAIGRENCPARESRMAAIIERLKARMSTHWRDEAQHRAGERLARRIS